MDIKLAVEIVKWALNKDSKHEWFTRLLRQALQTLIDNVTEDDDDCIYNCVEIAMLKKQLAECRGALDRAHKVFGAESDKLKKLKVDEGKIEKVLADVKGCKPNKEDCSLNRCVKWGECVLLTKSIVKAIEG